ncbi:MAG TPA: glycerophosphodiester phosphodiesterase family protein [Xanthobacteraceae bacterium]|jgi:glycerophosphoryl diester phosphodiesterase
MADSLTAKPIAHRGLHDAARGVIENTVSAVIAAIDAGYGIEVDLQVTSDGDAMVYHDEALGRLTEGGAQLNTLTAAELRRIPFKSTADRMLSLRDLCDLVAGGATLLLELKSRHDGNQQLARHVADTLCHYSGPVAAMSFDPEQILMLRDVAPALRCGLVAQRRSGSGASDPAPGAPAHLRSLLRGRAQFLAYSAKDLPAAAPLLATALRRPVLAWTVRSEEDRDRVRRWADQVIFEGFRP